MYKHNLYPIVKERRESQYKDIMMLLMKKRGERVWYNKFSRLWIWPVSTKMSELRVKLKPHWYTVINKMERTKKKWRRKINSSFILEMI